MASCEVLIKASAEKELEAVADGKDRTRLISRIRRLKEDPRPPNCERLSGRSPHYRVRQGDYRIVYTVDDAGRVVTIIKVGHRRDVYR